MTTHCRHPADFVVVEVGGCADDDLGAARTVAQQRDEVALRAAAHQQRRFLSRPLGGEGLETRDGGVLVVDVVAERRAGERSVHRLTRKGEGVTAEIDRLLYLSLSSHLGVAFK
jgi:hypothetical protein